MSRRPAAWTRLAAGALLAALAACSPAAPTTPWAGVHEITPAFLAGVPALDPTLAAGPAGRLALTYVVRDTGGADVWLTLSADSGAHFGTPVRINPRRGTVASYAESRPVVVFAPGGRVVVAWSAVRDSSGNANDVVARGSDDGGVSFGPERTLNSDRAEPASGYHGFVALAAGAGGRVLASWLDGRAEALAPGEREPQRAEIRLASSADGGQSWGPDARVAGDACPCCRPALRANEAGGIALAYRGVRDSVRDPRLALSRDGGATFAPDTLVSRDGWTLAGCPSVGPAVTLADGGGVYAWFTGAPGAPPGVYTARWSGAGPSLGARVAQADSVIEASHPMLAPLGGAALLGVLARPATDRARHVLALRVLAADDSASPWLLLGAAARSATLASEDARHACAGWVEQTAAGPRLRVARITLR